MRNYPAPKSVFIRHYALLSFPSPDASAAMEIGFSGAIAIFRP